MRIVLATREADLRLSIELLLSEEPGVHIVDSASDTYGLGVLIEAACPDLVILDWELPGESVLEVLSREYPCKERPQFILLGADDVMREEALSAGAQAYLLKGNPPEGL